MSMKRQRQLHYKRMNGPSGLPTLTGDLEDSLSKSADVLAGDASNGDATVLRGIHGVLLGECVHLFGRETGVRKHANLERNENIHISHPPVISHYSSPRGFRLNIPGW